MASRKKALLATVMAASVAGVPYMLPTLAYADDYADLLDVLRAKGSLTRHEYDTLLAKHVHHAALAAEPRAARPAHVASGGTRTAMAHAARGAQSGYEPGIRFDPGAGENDISLRAEDAATRAEASARSAQEAAKALDSGNFVRVAKYVPGKGLTFKAGPIDINLSGFVNGFYTYNSPAGGRPVAGGVSSGSSGFDSSAVRNGLLPAGFILKMNTVQQGMDISAVLGMYPGLDNAKPAAFNANSGGSPVGLGTAGIDLRQVYMTFGNKDMGTFKIGRDLALFASDAIMNDATLLSVGSTGSNASPANTSLGRIGVGYVYADWIPQISYTSPKLGGFQGSVGIFQPLDEFGYADATNPTAASAASQYSAGSTQHSSPMVQGRAVYDFSVSDVQFHIWASFLIQHMQGLSSLQADGKTPLLSSDQHHSAMVEAGDIGTKVTYGPLEGVAYYYRGSGLGTTGLFFDGVDASGRKRDSEGYYVQGAYHITKKFRLVGSYGVSNLYLAGGENTALESQAGSAGLVRRNQSEVGAAYYQMTDWLTVVGEYSHTSSSAHGGSKESDNTASGGVMLMF
ncbi:MAG: porin [Acetobacter fabarum]|uniref:porin n=1 Tax=Acetobacter fabarum TaxID=483199 RepID=UPI0020A02E61|nr:porin [Acetobacter fabarum]MCH4026889.1 porin [Acetobacter fabarum]MCH4054979.1 porin [Acetobacter fabarum]MCH4085250.1 porin [Acetobacter fabarum]MCH4127205.1 porin [Acetobacter fabarum]MCH4137507.1 porin [Acetobacter fabarum]